MGKRSDKPRIAKDKYRTPMEAVLPLLPHLSPRTRFAEPCAGDGRLARHLEVHGHRCLGMWDTDPDHADVHHGNAERIRWPDPGDAIWITNPPWRRDWLHPIIRNLIRWAPAWLLFDAGWMHNGTQYPVFQPYLRKIVSIGRVRWIEGSDFDSMDDCCWYLFDPQFDPAPPVFIGPA